MRKILASWLACGALLLLGTAALAKNESAPPAAAPKAPSDAPKAVPQAPKEGLLQGRKYTEQLYRGELKPLHAKFSDDMKKQMTLEQFSTFLTEIQTKLGRELEVLGEDITLQGDYKVYSRRVRFEKHKGEIEVNWALRPDNSIAGVSVGPRQGT